MSCDIFQAYADVDSNTGRRVLTVLEESGFSCWCPQCDLSTDTAFSNLVEMVGCAVTSAQAVVQILSRQGEEDLLVNGIVQMVFNRDPQKI